MRCPICDKPVVWKGNSFRPFCSERCKLIDFGHWVDENYTVPSDEAPPEESLAAAPHKTEEFSDKLREDF